MTRPRNWSGNHEFGAAKILRPKSRDQVRDMVAASRKIHAVGARHSFNGVADSPGDMIDLADMPADIVIDRDGKTVTAGAAITYGALASHLNALGFALHNMASLPHISLAGATATGTHGSGDALGTLSSAVAGLEMVTAKGDVLDIRRGGPGFDAMVVGLGAFGVITRVTLDIQPSYRMRQDAFEGLPWGAVLENFDAVMGAGTSVSLFTTWSGAAVDRLWIKTRLDDGAPDIAPKPPAGATPAEIPFVGDTPDSFRRLTPFGVAGPWQDRLPHTRLEIPLNLQSQSEYMLPRHRAAEAISLLRAIGPRIDRELVLTEIRTMTADAAWLSPAYGVDTVGLHFSWHLRDAAAVADITREIEGMMLPLGGRPHWGKVVHARAARLAPLYPRMSDFRALVGKHDPDGKFRNEFLERHVLGNIDDR